MTCFGELCKPDLQCKCKYFFINQTTCDCIYYNTNHLLGFENAEKS